MAPKKRANYDHDEEEKDTYQAEPEEVEVEETVPEEPTNLETESAESKVPFEMGKMYIAGVDDDDENEGPVDVDAYEEIDDSRDIKKARELLSGATNDDDLGMGTTDEDPFLKEANYDPSEEWVLGD